MTEEAVDSLPDDMWPDKMQKAFTTRLGKEIRKRHMLEEQLAETQRQLNIAIAQLERIAELQAKKQHFSIRRAAN